MLGDPSLVEHHSQVEVEKEKKMLITSREVATKISPMKNFHDLISHNIIEDENFENRQESIISIEDKEEESSDSNLLNGMNL